MDRLEEYIKELGVDTELNEFTVRDVQLKLPAIKHKWVGRLMREKINKDKLYHERTITINKMADTLMANSHIKLSAPMARNKVEAHDKIIEIDNLIRESKAVIELLEKAEKIFNSMTFDIKNLTEIMKLETQ